MMKFVPIEGLDCMTAPEILLTKIKLARKFPEDVCDWVEKS